MGWAGIGAENRAREDLYIQVWDLLTNVFMSSLLRYFSHFYKLCPRTENSS